MKFSTVLAFAGAALALPTQEKRQVASVVSTLETLTSEVVALTGHINTTFATSAVDDISAFAISTLQTDLTALTTAVYAAIDATQAVATVDATLVEVEAIVTPLLSDVIVDVYYTLSNVETLVPVASIQSQVDSLVNSITSLTAVVQATTGITGLVTSVQATVVSVVPVALLTSVLGAIPLPL